MYVEEFSLKKYLAPLPNKDLLNLYEEEMKFCKVPSSFLVGAKSAKCSVNYVNNYEIEFKEFKY